MAAGVTKTGFEYEIDTEVMDDWEFVEKLRDSESDDPLAVVDVIRMMLGKEQYQKMKDHCRGENGRISIQKMTDELSDILQSVPVSGE